MFVGLSTVCPVALARDLRGEYVCFLLHAFQLLPLCLQLPLCLSKGQGQCLTLLLQLSHGCITSTHRLEGSAPLQCCLVLCLVGCLQFVHNLYACVCVPLSIHWHSVDEPYHRT